MRYRYGYSRRQVQELASKDNRGLFERAVRASASGFRGIPGAKRDAPNLRTLWRVGDIVEVFSSSKKRWFDDGVVMGVEQSGSSTGPSSVKIRYAFGSAWKWEPIGSGAFRPPSSGHSGSPLPSTIATIPSIPAVDAKGDEKQDSQTKDGRPGGDSSEKSSREVELEATIAKLQADKKAAVAKDDFRKAGKVKTQIEKAERELAKARTASQKRIAALSGSKSSSPTNGEKSSKEVKLEATIAKLQADKKAAVAKDDFRRAGKVKAQLEKAERELAKIREAPRKRKLALEAVRSKIAELERAKFSAVETQDYTAAGKLKHQIESLQRKAVALAEQKQSVVQW